MTKFCLSLCLFLSLGNMSLLCEELHDCVEGKRKMELFYRGKKVLVTGGCGFIGSHLVHRLVELGADVTILDDLSGGFLENIQIIKDKVTFLRNTVVDKDVCREATRNKDIIFHLAALVSVPESIEKPELCHAVNVDGTVNLLEAARLNDVERFVLSSSAAVYGNREDRCIETMPCNPLSPYGFSKWIGELYCREYALLYGLKTVALRYFNVYGPRQNPNGAYAAVYAVFDQRMRDDEQITIFGDGLQTRDFIPVAHVVAANLIMAMQDEHILNGHVFNIATGNSINLLELFDQLHASYPHYDQETKFEPARPGDLKYSYADCSKYNNIREIFFK